MIDPTISRARLRDLTRLGRSRPAQPGTLRPDRTVDSAAACPLLCCSPEADHGVGASHKSRAERRRACDEHASEPLFSEWRLRRVQNQRAQVQINRLLDAANLAFEFVRLVR